MNSKRTNRLVSILNLVDLLSIVVFSFTAILLFDNIETYENVINSQNFTRKIYDNKDTIFQIIFLIVGAINITCAIENKNNKKLSFWYGALGASNIWSIVHFQYVKMDDYSFESIMNILAIILNVVVPIILAIINLIKIKQNKPSKIKIVSYIFAIILALFDIILIKNEMTILYWDIIIIIMQLIYVHHQDTNITESKKIKIINIILFYIIDIILTIFILLFLLVTNIIFKKAYTDMKNETTKLYAEIEELNGSQIEDEYIRVCKNNLYGFIDEKGKEKIPCIYDNVTPFINLSIDGREYYITLAFKDKNYYIISKKNETIKLDDNSIKYALKSLYGLNETLKEILQQNHLSYQMKQFYESDLNVKVTEKNNAYVYVNKNYTMQIEEADNSSSNSTENDVLGDLYNVTITKLDGTTENYVEYLPGFVEEENTLYTLSNGDIKFVTEDKTMNGWYNDNGDKISISSKYDINDIINEIIILEEKINDENYNYYFMSLSGQVLKQTSFLDIKNEGYLIKNENNKYVMLDRNLNTISSEYDEAY